MRRLVIVLTIIGVSVAPRTGRTQSMPLSGSRLHASVEINPGNLFIYRYTVENGTGSTAAIWRMTIDTSLPAGASTPPPGWRATAGADGTARWVAIANTSWVLPKQRLAGFSLTSQSPPSLRQFTLAPHIDPDRAPVMAPGDDPGESDRYTQEFDQYVESQSLTGITLAPAPVALTADALLANLANQVVQARALRWISSDAIARNLTEKLQAARAALLRRQLETSGNILRALRTEVTAQSGKALTSEAAALVDLNIQYLTRTRPGAQTAP